MSALRHVAQGFRNLWGAADEYDDSPDSQEEHESRPQIRESYHDSAPDSQPDLDASQPEAQHRREPLRDPQRSDTATSRTERVTERYEKIAVPTSGSYSSAPPQNGGGTQGGGTGARRLRPISMPLRASREKNIYTLKPKSLDESSLAADYLKTGCAVVINLEEVEQGTAIRIIDFMSGVCYGLEHQGHAMKLGDKIFLFTPGDFEISSDEVDYAENPDLIFKDVKSAPLTPASEPALGAAERRSWER